jgi:ubiquinone/menaquinone biosynthesis C-methylase UbiE
MESEKQLVYEFWDEASCGENLYMKGDSLKEQFINQSKERYRLEPEILTFAEFDKFKGNKTLEIGVGLGSDHQKWAEAGTELYGCDLTNRAIENTTKRFEVFGLKSELRVADAENLPYENESFDLVYSWGVIHHSPNTPKAASEIYRILRKGGKAKVMIYHKYSMIGYMLWIRYALMTLKPFRSLEYIYAHYLESPGTKAYSRKEANAIFKQFSKVEIETLLGHGDLLTSNAGQRHRGIILTIAKIIYPRFLIKMLLSKHGLAMLINLEK